MIHMVVVLLRAGRASFDCPFPDVENPEYVDWKVYKAKTGRIFYYNTK